MIYKVKCIRYYKLNEPSLAVIVKSIDILIKETLINQAKCFVLYISIMLEQYLTLWDIEFIGQNLIYSLEGQQQS